MKLKLMGKKRGMTQLFDEFGHIVPCTVIEVEPNVITQIKRKETDGYNAVQTGFEKVIAKDPRTVEKRVKKPLHGKFNKIGVESRRYLAETRLKEIGDFEVGHEFGVSYFSDVEFVDAIAVSIGKGFQGVMKLFNFAGGPASHGSSKFHRGQGSTGMLTPGRSVPNEKRPRLMGAKRVTTQNLKVMRIDEEAGVIIVKGSVPGPKNAMIKLQPAVKK